MIKRNSGLFIGLAVIFTIIFTVLLISVIIPAINGVNDYARLTELDYKAVVIDEEPDDEESPNARGKVLITEKLTFEIHAASSDNLFWELWRALPEEYYDGVKVEYNVLSVKRLTVNGQSAYLELEEASKLYWNDWDYTSKEDGLGPDRWFHSKGPYDDYYNFECLMIYVDGLYRQTVVYEIQYEMYNASLRYGDCSELYLSLFSGSDVYHLKSLKGQILFPNGKMPGFGNYSAYTYGTNSHVFDFTESATLNAGYYTFLFSLDKSQLSFSPYNEYIEFALIAYGADKHKFTEHASVNNYYNANVLDKINAAQADYEALPSRYKTTKIIVLAALFMVAVFIVLMIVLYDRNNKKKFKLYKPTQDFTFYREIPKPLDATFAGAFAFCKHRKSDDVPGGYAAAMLGLIRKRYMEAVKINENRGWEVNNVKINLNLNVFDPETGRNLLSPLTYAEEQYLALLRRYAKNGQVTLTYFQNIISQDYENTTRVMENIKSSVKDTGMSEGYFQTRAYKEKRFSMRPGIAALTILGIIAMLVNLGVRQTRLDLAFGAFFVLGAGFIFAAILLLIFSKKYVLLTQSGEDEYSKWRGLYKYLNSETLLKERTVPDVAIWEEYLIYATAFGIAEKVIKALKVRFPNYNFNNSRIVGHPYLCSRAFIVIYARHSFRTAIRTASFSSRTGGHGFGGGGGYGGGGRGGGGGGGGH